jgi:hypothetical protein
MNSIGVDFKLKQVELDGKIVKLQIVTIHFIFSGIQLGRKDFIQLQLVTIGEPMRL